ncbi:MAG TPA: FAD-binding oxidoreductase [Candidatus Saccharimonadales bacterium]|nr:FAD-binding oxidoreductase [Candidatus Saccharimonadales bacterium]
MSKIAHYLQEHLVGEVMTGIDARRYFSTDGSILTVPPAVVVYPRNENDIRKIARFSWQLAERGRVIPLTARGSGTDVGGAALGSGIMMVFPAHLHRILELDSKSGTVTVEPGINYGKLQQTLKTHDRFLPPYPASAEYSTIGGAVANNASGEKSLKYGDTRTFVKSLRVVLANGEVIETGRLNKRDFSKKLGLATFEGEIYRSVDTLLEEHRDLVERSALPVSKNTAGYDLVDIKRRDGSFDLTPLFVGSQGTLGVLSEITLATEEFNPVTTLLMASFASLRQAQDAILELRAMNDGPSAIEMVDGNLLQAVHDINPNQLKGIINTPFPPVVLLVEFDDPNERHQKSGVKKAKHIFDHHATSHIVETDLERQEQLWKARQAAGIVTGHTEGLVKAVPVIDDAVVPVERFADYLTGVYALFKKENLKVAVWGHAGDGNVHLQPSLNIGQIGDRQKLLRLMDEFYKLVISLGGSSSGEYNDGRMRAPYLERLYGTELYTVFQKLKQIFDPYGTLNPGVKMNVSLDDIKPLIRQEFGLNHLYDHLPRS